MTAEAATDRLPKATLNALLIVVLAVAAPHALRLPVWLSGLALLLGVWRWQIGVRGRRLPPRALRLARDWAAANPTPEALVARVLRHFRRQPFVYTLTPPQLTGDTVDQFLFETRRGFCGHYASAFAVLMRAAGVPTRIVTGYLGGEMSPDDSYMIVRQSDAHAWAEVWLAGKGWTRVDPTAAVSPERVELGLGQAVSPDEPIPALARPDGGWIKDLRLAWDGLDAAWNRWVLGYGPRLQQRLLGVVGLGDWRRMAAALGVGLALAMAAGVALALRGAPVNPTDPVQKSWERFCKRLARAGLPRRPHEGPRDYARRVAARRPDLAAEVGHIAALYSQLRYGRHASHRSRQRLLAAISRFRPRRRKIDTPQRLRDRAESPTVDDSTR